MRFRYIVEGEDAPAQFKKEIGAKGNEKPEWQLMVLARVPRGEPLRDFPFNHIEGKGKLDVPRG